MIYDKVCVEGFGYKLPENVVSSADIEEWLKPVYQRLKLPEGRLELMTGIKERRFWASDTRPSDAAIMAGKDALEKTGVEVSDVDCLINCSVCRDFLEPATASVVHSGLGLRSDALNFDISNACLGIASGMMVAGAMIESGQIDCALLVAGEKARPLVEATVKQLLDNEYSRKEIKPYFASLTIGSSAVAVVLTSSRKSKSGHRLIGGYHYSNTNCNDLCQGDSDKGMTDNSAPMMETDSEELLVRGVEVAEQCWLRTKDVLSWTNDTPDVICCHQVGLAHTRLLFGTLGLDIEKDYSTFNYLGNCGSVSLPITVARAAEEGAVKKGDKLALLGIGSGINSVMFGIEW